MPAHELKSSIEIDATPRHVWTILKDFARYPEWNPFIPFIRGRPEPGNRLQVRIQPSGTKGMNFRPVVVAADKERELRWLGRLIVPGIFDGEHRFTIRDSRLI